MLYGILKRVFKYKGPSDPDSKLLTIESVVHDSFFIFEMKFATYKYQVGQPNIIIPSIHLEGQEGGFPVSH